MNVQDAVYQASRWIGDKTRDYLADRSETSEPTGGELWDKVSPLVDNGLTIYAKMESAPDSTWNPFADSKESCQKDLDRVLDALLEILEVCGAAENRKNIRRFQTDIAASKSQIGECRERILSAPTEDSTNFFEALWGGSREDLEEQIADAKDRIAEREGQIEGLKAAFREHLQGLGVDVSPDKTDSFLLPVEDGIVSMVAVAANIGRLTEQLQSLVDANE
jgi:hypothetical protein